MMNKLTEAEKALIIYALEAIGHEDFYLQVDWENIDIEKLKDKITKC